MCHWFQNLNSGFVLVMVVDSLICISTSPMTNFVCLCNHISLAKDLQMKLGPIEYKWKPAAMRVELLRFLFLKIETQRWWNPFCGNAADVLPTLSSQRAKPISIGGLSAGKNSKLWIQVFHSTSPETFLPPDC